MVDKSIPVGRAIMIKHDVENYPRYSLPEGFYITGYKEGYERDWAEIEMEQEGFASQETGLKIFNETFASEKELLYDRCLFVVDGKSDTVAAVLSLWVGSLGSDSPKSRIHWVATREKYQGLGLMKAAFTYVMDLYHKLGLEGYIYLTTQTGSYKAINIYKKFGFTRYNGEYHTGGDFDKEKNEWAWRIIDSKLDEYKSKKNSK